MSDPVNSPSHYRGKAPFEAIDVIESFALSYGLGNAIKYILRAGRKNETTLLEDLRKSRWYLDREIQRIEQELAARGQK